MPAGRPPKYKSAKDLSEIIDAYFAECVAREKPPTIAGLAYALEMTTETLRAYGEKDKFSATVKRAKQRVEISLEERLDSPSPTGAIFNLKNNFGWKDQHDIKADVTARDATGLSDEELEAIATGSRKPTA